MCSFAEDEGDAVLASLSISDSDADYCGILCRSLVLNRKKGISVETG
jgi:hypothetical protein